jgi:hypothetical protein
MNRLRHLHRRRVLLSVAVAVAGAIAAGGAAYAVSGRNAAAVPPASVAPEALRAEIITRMNELGRPELAPAGQARLESIHVHADDRDWSLTTYSNSKGEQCFMEAIPNDGRAYRCVGRKALFGDGPLAVEWGSRQDSAANLKRWDAAWVRGFSTSPVSSVKVVATDCSSTPVRLNEDGAFFVVFGKRAMHAGPWPYLVRGLDANGTVVASRRVELEQPNAKGDDTVTGPQPSAACAGG